MMLSAMIISIAVQNIYHLLDNQKFELIRHDVTFPLYIEVSEIYPNNKFDRNLDTYGQRMHMQDHRVVSNFIVQALKGEKINIYGDVSQTRSLYYVDDLIDVFILLMNSDDKFLGPVNLGNSNELSI